jgi:hypothetical protein
MIVYSNISNGCEIWEINDNNDHNWDEYWLVLELKNYLRWILCEVGLLESSKLVS